MNCRTVPLFRHYNSTIIAINFDFNITDVSTEECVSYSFNHILVDCNRFTLLVQKLKFRLFFKFHYFYTMVSLNFGKYQGNNYFLCFYKRNTGHR